MTSRRAPGTDGAEARPTSGGRLPRAWHALRVKANRERVVRTALNARGFETFLPTWADQVRWSDRNVETQRCLFPGYVFARFDAGEEICAVLATPGVVQVLFANLDPTAIADAELDAVRRAAAHRTVAPAAYVGGEMVRVVTGPLAGLEGVVVDATRGGATRHRIVVALSMLRCAASVELGEADVVACAAKTNDREPERDAPARTPRREVW